MELSALTSLYNEAGSFATVFLEGHSPGEDAESQIRLRWQRLRKQLAAKGAADSALAALDAELERDKPGEEQANGRVLVASDQGRICLDEPWDTAPGGDEAHWGVLPELGPYVREIDRAARVLLVVADQTEVRLSRLVVSREQELQEESRDNLEGGAVEGPHHPRAGALSHRRIQRRADEAVKQNAKEFATAVTRELHEFTPDVVILAGEVQGRTALRDQLGDHVVETDRGGGTDTRAQQALNEEVLRVANEHVEGQLQENAARLNAAHGHQDAVQGHEQVLKAAETGALETLLLEDGTAAKREALLLKKAAQSGAAFALVPHGTGLTDGSGGILRFHPEG